MLLGIVNTVAYGLRYEYFSAKAIKSQVNSG